MSMQAAQLQIVHLLLRRKPSLPPAPLLQRTRILLQLRSLSQVISLTFACLPAQNRRIGRTLE